MNEEMQKMHTKLTRSLIIQVEAKLLLINRLNIYFQTFLFIFCLFIPCLIILCGALIFDYLPIGKVPLKISEDPLVAVLFGIFVVKL